jgi:hypothetical protein
MLSQRERRTLAAIEQRLSGEEPALQRLLAGFDRWAPARRRIRHRVAWWAVVVGVVLLGGAFALRNADLLLLAVTALLGAAAGWLVIAALSLLRRHASGARLSGGRSGRPAG